MHTTHERNYTVMKQPGNGNSRAKNYTCRKTIQFIEVIKHN